jgi:TolB-like protein
VADVPPDHAEALGGKSAIPDGSPSPPGAVFISYCSQDAPAAERICEAFRAVGISVWLDKNELRGGDAWDAQIRKRIHDCALFIPLISAHSNARNEGYFRREWKQAVRRLEDIADDVPFLLPVVIDETREGDARVPDEFLHAQWTWLPGGETPPAIAHRVLDLLGGEPGVPPVPHVRPSLAAAGRRRHRLRNVGIAIGALLLVLGLGLFWYQQHTGDTAADTPASDEMPAALAAPDERSIAVLPFVDLSPEKTQEYMSDGIAEELLNLLAQIPGLKVIARTSSFAFKGEKIEIGEIARKLNVAYVLEGSVRASGDKLRVAAQLIRAADSTHVWSERYDGSLKDIFAVQDEISAAVVEQLKIKLLGDAPKSKPVDPRAYAMFLQARQLNRQRSAEGFEQAVDLLQQAVAIAPDYAGAWDQLGDAYIGQANDGLRPIAEGYELAREAATKALALQPEFAPAHARLGRIAMNYDGDLAAAARHYMRALSLTSDDADIYRSACVFARSLGRLDMGIALCQFATSRDPVFANGYGNLAVTFRFAGRTDEAIASARMALRLSPGYINGHYNVAVAMLQQGKAREALAELQQEPAAGGWSKIGLPMVLHALGRKAESDAALAQLIREEAESAAYNIAYVHAFRNEPDKAFQWLDRARLTHDPGLSGIAVEPLFDNIKRDPRWLAYLRELGRAPEQLAAIKFDVTVPK